MLHLRPRNRFEDLESVYLVGGGTHPGSGLPVIFESARITSRLLVEDLGMPSCSWDLAAGASRSSVSEESAECARQGIGLAAFSAQEGI
jgi:phytoene desaturase